MASNDMSTVVALVGAAALGYASGKRTVDNASASKDRHSLRDVRTTLGFLPGIAGRAVLDYVHDLEMRWEPGYACGSSTPLNLQSMAYSFMGERLDISLVELPDQPGYELILAQSTGAIRMAALPESLRDAMVLHGVGIIPDIPLGASSPAEATGLLLLTSEGLIRCSPRDQEALVYAMSIGAAGPAEWLHTVPTASPCLRAKSPVLITTLRQADAGLLPVLTPCETVPEGAWAQAGSLRVYVQAEWSDHTCGRMTAKISTDAESRTVYLSIRATGSDDWHSYSCCVPMGWVMQPIVGRSEVAVWQEFNPDTQWEYWHFIPLGDGRTIIADDGLKHAVIAPLSIHAEAIPPNMTAQLRT